MGYGVGLLQSLEEGRSLDSPQSLVSLIMPCDHCSKLPSVPSSTKVWRERMMVTRLRLPKALDNLKWWFSALQRQRVGKTWLWNQKDRFHSQLLLLSLQTNCLISPFPVFSSANWMTPRSTSWIVVCDTAPKWHPQKGTIHWSGNLEVMVTDQDPNEKCLHFCYYHYFVIITITNVAFSSLP